MSRPNAEIDGFEEVTECPVCHGTSRRLWRDRCKDLLTSCCDLSFCLYICKGCGCVYLSPRPKRDAILAVYPPGEYLPPEPDTGGEARSGGRPARLRRLLKAMVRVPYRLRFGSPNTTLKPFGNGRLLEVGCGNGEYLAAMRALGWEVYGCDIDSTKVEYVRDALDVQHVFLGSVEDLGLPGAHFDAIAMWHVIEHLHDPLGALQEIRRLLRAGGRLVIGTPNFASFESRLFGKWWKGLDVPRHLVMFSITSLCRLLEACGFSVRRVRPSFWLASVPESLVFLWKDLTGSWLWKTRGHRALLYLCSPFVGLSYVLGNWGVIELEATRNE